MPDRAYAYLRALQRDGETLSDTLERLAEEAARPAPVRFIFIERPLL